MEDKIQGFNSKETVRKEYREKIKTGGNTIHTVLDVDGPITNYLYDYYSKYYIKKYSQFSGDDYVLDFGCGLGRLSETYAPLVKQIVAVDLSEELIDVARCNDSRNANVDYRVINTLADLNDLSAIFDKIYVFGVFLYLNDIELLSALEQFKRLGKLGVRIVFVEPTLINREVVNESLFYRTVQDYKELFEKQDFQLIYSENIIRRPSYSFNVIKKLRLKTPIFFPIFCWIERITVNRRKEFVDGYWHLFVFES